MPIASKNNNQATHTHYRACHLCEAICGLKIEVQGESIISIKGDDNDPLSRGHICPKAIALTDIHQDPDRLRQPMKRLRDQGNGDEWQTISWQEAIKITVDRILEIREANGPDALAAYFGNPSVHNYGMLTHQRAFFGFLKTRNRYSATSVDQLPHHLTSLWLFGHKDLFPIGDIDHTDHFLIIGGNPMASNGSIMTVPDIKKRLAAIQERGGKVVVVDPRFTETSAVADEHHFIRPGTDAWFLLALVHVLFDEDLNKDKHTYGDMVSGMNAVAKMASDFSPERAEPICGIKAGDIRQIARDIASAGSAICYGRMGVSVQEFGALNQWLVQLVNIITGNLDKRGGVLFTTPAFDSIPNSNPGSFGRFRSRVSGLPEFTGELPVAALAEEILTPGVGQVKALFTGAGNPVLSTPNGQQLDKALASLDFMVSLDPYINETTRHADIILPPVSPLETDHYDIAFHLNAVRNTTRYNPPVFEKPEDGRYDWEIFLNLGQAVAERLGQEAKIKGSPKDLVNFLISQGPYSEAKGHQLKLDLKKIIAEPSGIDLGPLEPSLPDRLCTADKKIRVDIPELMDDIQRVKQSEQALGSLSDLLLIGRRHIRSNNSWMHNYKRLVKGKSRCTLLMHKQDLLERNIQDGETVLVKSRVGELRVIVEATEQIMPGVVSLPHGWGHNRSGIKTSIASENPGVSVNDLTDDKFFDRLSGNAAVNGVPVIVERTAD